MTFKQLGKKSVRGAAVSAAVISAFSPITAQQNPNIILIMTDQQTADAMSNRGNPYVKTPAMDALAKEGVSFTRAYCAYPLSGPSRASLITGKMPVEIKVLENDDPLPEKEIPQTLGFRMTEGGYDCLYAGKWHIPNVDIPEQGFGFKKVCGMDDRIMAEKIDKALSVKREKPFFLVASYLNPHEICEYARSQTLHYGEITIPDKAILPPLPPNHNTIAQLPELLMLHKEMSPKLYPTRLYTPKDWQEYLYTYYRLVERVDKAVGDLISVLKKHGVYDNSVIIFTSDHGDGVAAHRWNQKRALFEETINVPLIVKPVKSNQPVKKNQSAALVNIGTDIYTTVCDYGNVTVPQELNGKSLKNVVEGKTTVLHPSISVETHLDGIDGRAWAVITDDYKYVFYRFFKYKEQLFDLRADKGETRNLVNNANYKSVRLEMRKKLLEHAKQLNDRMLIKDLSN